MMDVKIANGIAWQIAKTALNWLPDSGETLEQLIDEAITAGNRKGFTVSWSGSMGSVVVSGPEYVDNADRAVVAAQALRYANEIAE